MLVVEDDPANAQMVTAILHRAGHQVLTAPDGVCALASVRARHPDVILLDVSLAGAMDGLQVCRTLRAEPGAANMAIVMLSGWAFEADIDAGRDAGCDAYLPKPFNRQDLLAIIEQMLARPAEQQQMPT